MPAALGTFGLPEALGFMTRFYVSSVKLRDKRFMRVIPKPIPPTSSDPSDPVVVTT
jgi:hypothetical protein